MYNYQADVTLEQLEKEAIYSALHFFRGNKTKTAQALGVSVKTIQNKINKWEGRKDGEADSQVSSGA